MALAFEFFFNNTAHIDVVRNNKLELVYFILLPYTKSLPKDKKTAFHEMVDRSNVKSKVQDLVNTSDNYIDICKHEERLK
jgi:inositol 1,4,5-triphosphate receptor type 1